MNTSMSFHGWHTSKIKAEANFGSHGSCNFRMDNGSAEIYVFLPAAHYQTAETIAKLLNSTSEPASAKPFSTYPEDRAKLLALCAEIEKRQAVEDVAAVAHELSDLVRAILEDEILADPLEAA